MLDSNHLHPNQRGKWIQKKNDGTLRPCSTVIYQIFIDFKYSDYSILRLPGIDFPWLLSTIVMYCKVEIPTPISLGFFSGSNKGLLVTRTLSSRFNDFNATNLSLYSQTGLCVLVKRPNALLVSKETFWSCYFSWENHWKSFFLLEVDFFFAISLFCNVVRVTDHQRMIWLLTYRLNH